MKDLGVAVPEGGPEEGAIVRELGQAGLVPLFRCLAIVSKLLRKLVIPPAGPYEGKGLARRDHMT